MIFAKRSLSLALILTLLATFGEAALVTWSRSGSCTENFVNAVTTPIHQIDDALTSGLTASEEAPMLDSLQVVEQAHHEYSTGCFEQGFDIVPSTTRQVRGLPQPTLQQTVNPTQPLFNGCPAVGLTGSGAPPPQDMSELNLKKNRTDSPVGDIYQPISFHTFVDLPWSAGAMQQRAFAEGFPVAIEGYLGWVESQARESNNCTNDLATPTPNKISCNSHTGQPQENVDFHIWLLDYPVVGLDHSNSAFAQSAVGHARADAIIVEISPRVRANHLATWTVNRLCDFVLQGRPVRISGWTMLDPEHTEFVGQTRATLWEIHPVMRIEFWDGQQWEVLN